MIPVLPPKPGKAGTATCDALCLDVYSHFCPICPCTESDRQPPRRPVGLPWIQVPPWQVPELLQFNNELNNTNARLAEEVEMSTNTAEQYNKAVEQARDMARALAVAVSSCRKQKAGCKIMRQKIDEKVQTIGRVSKERDVAHAQVCATNFLNLFKRPLRMRAHTCAHMLVHRPPYGCLATSSTVTLTTGEKVQVDVKAQHVTELKAALQAASAEIKAERMHTAETDQMLTREKKLAASLREELDSLKQQMSAEKDKLSSALKKNAASAAQLTGLQLELCCTPEPLKICQTCLIL